MLIDGSTGRDSAQTVAANVAYYDKENAALRQRVDELERLVGQLKHHLWPAG